MGLTDLAQVADLPEIYEPRRRKAHGLIMKTRLTPNNRLSCRLRTNARGAGWHRRGLGAFFGEAH